MKTTQKGSAAVIFVIVILILLIAGAVFAYKSVANEEATSRAVDTSSQQASVPAVTEATATDTDEDISANIEASLVTSDEDLKAMSSEFKK